MARTTGPLFSLDASGSTAGAITFSKSKGRTYVRKLVTPKNPKSQKQTGTRAMMKYLAQLWATITADAKASWDDLAQAKNISPFNAFTAENLDRWQSNKAPTHAYPAAELKECHDVNLVTTTKYQTYAEITIALTEDPNRSAIAIYYDPDGAPKLNWAQAIAIVPATTEECDLTYTHRTPESAAGEYGVVTMSDDGYAYPIIHGD
jgi:hypothetical protein